MTPEERKEREAVRYRRLRFLRPDLYERAVQIGTLVQIGGAELDVAARIESAVVSLLLEVCDQ